MTETIPGTFVSRETKSIRYHRMPDTNGCRAYHAIVSDGCLVCLVSQDVTDAGPLWHMSISHRDNNNTPDRCPTWDEMKHAKFQLMPVDVPMVLIFPTKGALYVNEYPTCLHLWEAEKGIDQ